MGSPRTIVIRKQLETAWIFTTVIVMGFWILQCLWIYSFTSSSPSGYALWYGYYVSYPVSVIMFFPIFLAFFFAVFKLWDVFARLAIEEEKLKEAKKTE